MFQGLFLYEIILVIAGAILFLALVFILIWSAVKNKSFVTLLPFFLIPIIMIGWPAITSINYNNGNITIQKAADQVISNPSDTAVAHQLEASLANIDTARAASDPNALETISQAYYALGKYDSATLYNNRALQLNPSLQKAIQLKQNINQQVAIKNNFDKNVQQLQNNLNQLQSNNNSTNNNAIKSNIANILQSTQQPVYTTEQSNLVIAKALAAVNDSAQCASVINNILKYNPQSTEAIQLKQNIVDRKLNAVKNDSSAAKIISMKKFNSVIKK